MKTKRTNQLLCLLMLVFGLSICSLDAYGKDSSPVMNQDAPVYHSPNNNAEKRRLEAGDSESANRGVRVRGVRVRGVRVRGVRVRGGQDGQDGGHFSSGLTDDLSNMLDMESVTNPNNATEEIHFPERLSPIASEQTGFTSHEQPDLYWYISAPFHGPVAFKLNEPLVSKPVLSIQLDGFPSEGIYGVKLSEYKLKLKQDIEYEWFITIITDPEERSGDIYASATIKYVKPTQALILELSKVSPHQKYYAYAKTGYWYDAIGSITRLINESSNVKQYRLHRSALLKQVNLPRAAKYDLMAINITR